MKVLALNGSPHKNGGTAAAIKLVSFELEKHGIETEIIQIGNEVIKGCIGCMSCKKTGSNHCIFNEDIVNVCIDKSAEFDGLILASPVYYGGIAGTMKSFLDRFFFAGINLEYKAAVALVTVRRAGGVETFQQLNNYFNLRNMVITPSQYWNVLHGTNEEEIQQDKEGVQIMQKAGNNMAWLLKNLDAGKDIPLPEKPQRVATNFIRQI